ncbi:MAG: hypothetical protein LBH54_02005 [Clostridiales bacterium]|nr:hypothetical protein [Clostridiales bacterium]
MAIINVTIEIKNKAQLDKVIKRFWNIPGVSSVIRTRL